MVREGFDSVKKKKRRATRPYHNKRRFEMREDDGIRMGTCDCVGCTSKAIYVMGSDFLSNGVWIPQVAVHDDSEVWQQGQEGELVVCEWFAKKKGWV